MNGDLFAIEGDRSDAADAVAIAPAADFFALCPDAPARSDIERQAGKIAREGRFPDLRLRGNPHVTVVYVDGPTRLRTTREAALVRAGDAIRSAAIDVVLDRVVSFKGGTRGHPLVLCADAASADAIGALRHGLLVALEAEGFRPSRAQAFVPHLTLAYPHTSLTAPLALESSIHWQASRLFLLRSHVGRGVHEVLAEWPLGAYA